MEEKEKKNVKRKKKGNQTIIYDQHRMNEKREKENLFSCVSFFFILRKIYSF